jgi:hypothetical protein
MQRPVLIKDPITRSRIESRKTVCDLFSEFMNPSSTAERILLFALSILLFAGFAFQLTYQAVRTSATVDEPFIFLPGIVTGSAAISASIRSIRRY